GYPYPTTRTGSGRFVAAVCDRHGSSGDCPQFEEEHFPLPGGLLNCLAMILTLDELRSLMELKHQSPHTLLGMHPLGDQSGLVVRALLPDAKKVEIQPVHEKDK